MVRPLRHSRRIPAMTRSSESGSQAPSLETSVTIVGPMRTSGVSDSDAGSVELEDLSRFEGEGGPEAPILELVDVPLDNAIWRRSRWAGVGHRQQEIEDKPLENGKGPSP